MHTTNKWFQCFEHTWSYAFWLYFLFDHHSDCHSMKHSEASLYWANFFLFAQAWLGLVWIKKICIILRFLIIFITFACISVTVTEIRLQKPSFFFSFYNWRKTKDRAFCLKSVLRLNDSYAHLPGQHIWASAGPWPDSMCPQKRKSDGNVKI